MIVNWPIPQTISNVRSFLGLENIYHIKVHKFSEFGTHLTELTKSDKLHWSLEAEKSFDALTIALSTTPVMAIPDPTLPFVVMTDASDQAIGGVLMQNNRVIAFDSKKFNFVIQLMIRSLW